MLDDNWLIEDVIALVFYVVFPVFILSGIVGLWRTRSKPPEWRTRVLLTWSRTVSRDRYRLLLAILIVEGILGMVVFSFLASMVEG